MTESGIYCPRCGKMTEMVKDNHAECLKCGIKLRTFAVNPHQYSIEVKH